MFNKTTTSNFQVPKKRPIRIVDPNTPTLGKESSVSTDPPSNETGQGAIAKTGITFPKTDRASSFTVLPETVLSDRQPVYTETVLQAWKANVYAQPYIPLALSAINLSPATIIVSEPIASIDFPCYISSFAGRQYLMPHAPLEVLTPSNVPNQPSVPLESKNYVTFFKEALASELEAEAATTSSYNLYQVRLERKNPQEQLYQLQVPGLREDRPRLNLGDIIELRQLRINLKTGGLYGMEQWLMPGGGRDRGFVAPAFTGVQYIASVWGLDRSKEQLLLRVDGCVDESLMFNVIFRVQQKRYEPFQRAIADVSTQLNQTYAEQLNTANSADITRNRTNGHGDMALSKSQYIPYEELTGDGNEIEVRHHSSEICLTEANLIRFTTQESSIQTTWMRRMLFPNQSDGVEQSGLPQGVFKRKFFDENLNFEQQASIQISSSSIDVTARIIPCRESTIES